MIDEKQLTIFLCKILRHEPKRFGVNVDEYGSCDMDELVEAINNQKNWNGVTKELILKIAREDKKERYQIGGNTIRARYGHSYPVKHKTFNRELPTTLYHGTNKKSLFKIMDCKEGLLPMKRENVHLSESRNFADLAAKRRKDPRMIKVDVKKAQELGVSFTYVGNEVWLSGPVPVECLEEIKF